VTVERRIGALFAVFLGLLVVALLQALRLGMFEGSSLAQRATSQQVMGMVVPARRGTIVDRRGVQLAVSEPADDISATPYIVKNPARAAGELAPILGIPKDVLFKKLAQRNVGFVYLARTVPAVRADRVRRLDIPGVDLTPTTMRVYPRGSLASQVLGHVGTDGVGLSGIEYSRNPLLRGHDGRRRVIRDALGQSISVRDVTPAQSGARLELTLDATIQGRVEDVLAELGQKYQPKSATAIVMDPRDNEILAMANWPRVDANQPGSAPAYALENRAVGFTYEPGSTFKAFTVAGALEDHLITPGTMFDLPPTIRIGGRTIGEAHARGWEHWSTADILKYSSNVGAITIGGKLGPNRFDYYVRKFGFGKPTGVDLPGEEQGLVIPPSKYSGSSMGNLPMGQGEAVTLMQMATGYAAIANGGILRPAHIVRRINDQLVPEPAGRRVMSVKTSDELKSMLEGVFGQGGTAQEVHINGYQLAGKTGTANKIDPSTGLYSSSKYVASFIGFAPAMHPRLLIAVMADEPQNAIYGGVVAAPAFGEIASFALPYLRIPPG
jgi:cell division protein FtsI/penicillin-binding protein 2